MASFWPLVHRLSPATKARTVDKTYRLTVAQPTSSTTIAMNGQVNRNANGTGLRPTGCKTSMDGSLACAKPPRAVDACCGITRRVLIGVSAHY
ncbi:hypothetical protein D3C71_1371310 [compost metagenome]